MEISPNFSDKAKRDFQLVKRASAGDQKAYAELLGYYRDSLYFMLLKMVRNKADAEDLTIEAFGKAFKNIDSYSPDFAFSTWLFKIATNNGIDFIRAKKKRYKTLSIDEINTDNDFDFGKNIALPADVRNPEERMIAEQKEDFLKILVKRLHPDYRRIVTLRYFEEFSYLEISEKLELPLGTVKARLFRARELMLSILKKHNKDRNL